MCFDCEKLQTRPEHGGWNYVNTGDFRAHPQDYIPEPASILHKDDPGKQAVHGTLGYKVGKDDVSHVGETGRVAQLDADACSVRIQAKEPHEAEPYVFIELRLPCADRTAWRYHEEKEHLPMLQFDLAHRLLRPNDCFHRPQRRNLGWENIEKKTIEDSPKCWGYHLNQLRRSTWVVICSRSSSRFVVIVPARKAFRGLSSCSRRVRN